MTTIFCQMKCAVHVEVEAVNPIQLQQKFAQFSKFKRKTMEKKIATNWDLAPTNKKSTEDTLPTLKNVVYQQELTLWNAYVRTEMAGMEDTSKLMAPNIVKISQHQSPMDIQNQLKLHLIKEHEFFICFNNFHCINYFSQTPFCFIYFYEYFCHR